MANYRKTETGAWVEVDDKERIIRIIDPGTEQTEIEPYTAQMPEAIPVRVVAPSVQQQVILKTSYVDRARAFNVKVRWLAVPVSIAAALLAYVGVGIPVLSIRMLTVISCSYMATWLIAFIWSELTSADGVSLLHTIMGWNYLRREQRERHRYYRWMERK